MQNMNMGKTSWETFKTRYKQARELLDFSIRVIIEQISHGRYFVFEHPLSSRVWKLACMSSLMGADDIFEVSCDQCQYGLVLDGKPIMKPTRFLTNSEKVVEKLGKRCSREHVHGAVLGGNSKRAQ